MAKGEEIWGDEGIKALLVLMICMCYSWASLHNEANNISGRKQAILAHVHTAAILLKYIFLFNDNEVLMSRRKENYGTNMKWYRFFGKSIFLTLILNLNRIHPANCANHPFKSGYMVSLAMFPQWPSAKTEQTRIWATETIVHRVRFHEHACLFPLTEKRGRQRFCTTGLM